MDLGQGHAASGRAVNGQHHFIPTCRRRKACASGRGDEAIGSAHIGCAKSEADRVGRTASEHAGAVERIGAHAVKGGVVGKQVHRQEIGVLSWAPARVPQCKLGIIAKVCWVCRIHLQRIKEPAAVDGILGLRHGDTLPEGAARKRWKGEIADQPATSILIVDNIRITVVRKSARSASQRREE